MKKLSLLSLAFMLAGLTMKAQESIIFQDLSNMNYVRASISSANDGKNLYVCNGFSTIGYLTEIEKYNIATNTWSVFAHSLVAKSYPSSEVVGDNLYIINGINGTTYNSKVEVVNLTNGNVTYSTDNPYPAQQSGSSVWNNKIYIFAGNTATGYSDKLYCFDTETQIWTELASMPEAKTAKGEIINGKLYVIGGYNGTTSTRIDVYDIQTDTWSFVMNMPTGISAHATTFYQNKIWIVGDYANLTNVAYFGIPTNEFSTCTNNMTGRRHAGAEVINGKLYVMGGLSTSSGYLNSLQMTDLVNLPAGILTINDNAVSVYPNPTYDKIAIDCGNNYSTLNGYRIKITNSLSQTVYTSKVTQQSATIDLSTCTGRGIYFVHLIDGNGSTIDIKKIVFQ